jgi:hypothetical protein
MRPTWLIESGVYGDEITPLLAEIRRQGMPVAVVPYQSLTKGSVPVVDGQSVSPDACVIAYGTFPFARQVQLHHPWMPGAWCNPQNLDCAKYYAYFGRFLLNQHYAIMPGVEAIRQRDWLFTVLGEENEIFARPTSCHKLFVGRRVSRETFADILSPTRYDPATAVVIAQPKEIGREWRLIVIGDRVVSGSQYAVNGERAITADLPGEVIAYSQSMLSEVRWRPDPVFMLDVCESAGRLWLVELNSFSGSWLYQCDLEAVVAGAADVAQGSWEAARGDPAAA